MTRAQRLAAVAVLVAGAITGCASPPDPRPDGADSMNPAARTGPVTVRPLMREQNSGQSEAARRLITTQAEFQAAWDEAYRDRGPKPALPSVDFSREVVALAALGTRGSGGYTIDIDSARVSAAALEIFVRTTSPGPTCGATAALTEPVVMVALPKSSLPPRFQEENRSTDCG